MTMTLSILAMMFGQKSTTAGNGWFRRNAQGADPGGPDRDTDLVMAVRRACKNQGVPADLPGRIRGSLMSLAGDGATN